MTTQVRLQLRTFQIESRDLDFVISWRVCLLPVAEKVAQLGDWCHGGLAFWFKWWIRRRGAPSSSSCFPIFPQFSIMVEKTGRRICWMELEWIDIKFMNVSSVVRKACWINGTNQRGKTMPVQQIGTIHTFYNHPWKVVRLSPHMAHGSHWSTPPPWFRSSAESCCDPRFHEPHCGLFYLGPVVAKDVNMSLKGAN